MTTELIGRRFVEMTDLCQEIVGMLSDAAELRSSLRMPQRQQAD
jgi:hypothetical protein